MRPSSPLRQQPSAPSRRPGKDRDERRGNDRGKQGRPTPSRSSTRRLVAVLAFAGLGLGGVGLGCTFLVDFKEKTTEEDAGVDIDVGTLPEGDAGVEDTGTRIEDTGAVDVDVDAADGPKDNPCIGKPNGTSWNAADEFARCCNGLKVRTTVDAFCGTCEIACNKAKGQVCEAFGAHYYCRGCQLSTECWSGCCSKQFGGGSCAASNCISGDCNAALCKGGSVCVVPGDASNYCKY